MSLKQFDVTTKLKENKPAFELGELPPLLVTSAIIGMACGLMLRADKTGMFLGMAVGMMLLTPTFYYLVKAGEDILKAHEKANKEGPDLPGRLSF